MFTELENRNELLWLKLTEFGETTTSNEEIYLVSLVELACDFMNVIEF